MAKRLWRSAKDPGPHKRTHAGLQPLPLVDRMPSSPDPAVLFSSLQLELQEIIAASVPLAQVKEAKPTDPQWLTPGVRSLVTEYDREWARFQKHGRPGAEQHCRRLKSRKRAAIAEAKREWQRSECKSAASTKTLWDLHKRLSQPRRDSALPPIWSGDVLAVTDLAKAAVLSTHFQASFAPPEVAALFPAPSAHPLRDTASSPRQSRRRAQAPGQGQGPQGPWS